MAFLYGLMFVFSMLILAYAILSHPRKGEAALFALLQLLLLNSVYSVYKMMALKGSTESDSCLVLFRTDSSGAENAALFSFAGALLTLAAYMAARTSRANQE